MLGQNLAKLTLNEKVSQVRVKYSPSTSSGLPSDEQSPARGCNLENWGRMRGRDLVYIPLSSLVSSRDASREQSCAPTQEKPTIESSTILETILETAHEM
jgi:hypothetical protein